MSSDLGFWQLISKDMSHWRVFCFGEKYGTDFRQLPKIPCFLKRFYAWIKHILRLDLSIRGVIQFSPVYSRHEQCCISRATLILCRDVYKQVTWNWLPSHGEKKHTICVEGELSPLIAYTTQFKQRPSRLLESKQRRKIHGYCHTTTSLDLPVPSEMFSMVIHASSSHEVSRYLLILEITSPVLKTLKVLY